MEPADSAESAESAEPNSTAGSVAESAERNCFGCIVVAAPEAWVGFDAQVVAACVVDTLAVEAEADIAAVVGDAAVASCFVACAFVEA